MSKKTTKNKHNLTKEFILNIKLFLIGIAIAAVILSVLGKYIGFITTVPTGSMIPTIIPGDKLLIDSRSSSLKVIKRNVIYTFEKDGKSLIKRCIAVGGDTVEIENKDVYVNGNLVANDSYKPVFLDGNSKAREHKIFNVPLNNAFFLGDNRDESKDSRYWENPYVPYSNITGLAYVKVYPFDDFWKSLNK